MRLSTADLRTFALTRSLGGKTDLTEAIHALGFVQADPIRAPARAQDLILMQRVRGYKAGDLERRYPSLNVEEDAVHNYGFVSREVQRLLHPRETPCGQAQSGAFDLPQRVLDFVRERGSVHPRDLDAHFGRATIGNPWGGIGSAATQVLNRLHFGGHLRVVRRDKGIRVYGVADHLELSREGLSREEQARRLVQLLLQQYAPLPTQSLGNLVALLDYGAPHLKAELRAALRNVEAQRAKVGTLTYLWPEGETPVGEAPRRVRLLTPFDPVVWDRRRFEHLHGWAYKFEAYTPAPKRRFGYYALPLLWGAEAIGWANLKVEGGELKADVSFVDGVPKSKAFARALEAELCRHRAFLDAALYTWSLHA